jgi:hypothetical protein
VTAAANNARRRATAAVRADHRPRLQLHEPRVCRADEREITDRVHAQERDAKRARVAERIAATDDIASRVQTLRDALHADKSTSRGARDLARRVARDLRALTDMLERSV